MPSPAEDRRLPWAPTAQMADDEPEVTPADGIPLLGPTVDHADPL